MPHATLRLMTLSSARSTRSDSFAGDAGICCRCGGCCSPGAPLVPALVAIASRCRWSCLHSNTAAKALSRREEMTGLVMVVMMCGSSSLSDDAPEDGSTSGSSTNHVYDLTVDICGQSRRRMLGMGAPSLLSTRSSSSSSLLFSAISTSGVSPPRRSRATASAGVVAVVTVCPRRRSSAATESHTAAHPSMNIRLTGPSLRRQSRVPSRRRWRPFPRPSVGKGFASSRALISAALSSLRRTPHGSVKVKVEPLPRPSLLAVMVPPIAWQSFLLMASPSPVPSYLRVGLLSTCVKLSNMHMSPSWLTPMPVSCTLKEMKMVS
mmetsp:Transcript_2254/g.8202  ORF Transcript_2254/g.8202 Transcript_2254/m.8202 type:complete len:321 (+) Transcript_2254:392-1354(+)